MSTKWSTLRPATGPFGELVATDDRLGERRLRTLREHLDTGEGWTWETGQGFGWLFGERALTMSLRTDPSTEIEMIDVDIVVVERVRQLSPDLAWLLNHLNIWALGWVYWYDADNQRIVSTARFRVVQAEWWWLSMMEDSLVGQANAAEVAAEKLADVSAGHTVVAVHPERGPRPDVDGWLHGVRLGPQDLSAGLDPFISLVDVVRFRAAAAEFSESEVTVTDMSFAAVLEDHRGAPAHWVHKAWNANAGWVWQFSVIDGPGDSTSADDEEALWMEAAQRNTVLGASPDDRCLIGGWVAVDGAGLVAVSSIDPWVMTHIIDNSEDSFGVALAVMTMLLTVPFVPQVGDAQPADWDRAIAALTPLALAMMQSTVLPPLPDAASDDVIAARYFAGPRDEIVCAWGIFNPNGPTLGSIELTYTDTGVIVWYVQRHPHAPDIIPLRFVEENPDDDDELWDNIGKVITESMADPNDSVLGTWPDFIQIHEAGFTDAIREGFISHALGTRSVAEMLRAAASLRGNSSDPWHRVSRRHDGNESSHPSSDQTDPRTVAELLWEATSSVDVVAGHQLFMRSAWEGAKAYKESKWDPAAAQGVSDAIVYRCRNRALGDFTFRGNRHPLVLSASGYVARQDEYPDSSTEGG